MVDYADNPALRTVFVDKRASKRHLRKARLRVVEGPDAGREIEIGKTKIYVGRSKVNDLSLADSSISGTHFEIVAEEDGYVLRDLGSTNGVTAGGLRVKEAYLKAGCTFEAGNSKFSFNPSDDVVEIPLSNDDRFGEIIGRSVPMREIFATLEKVAPSDLTVLVQGETGTGKERVATSIHQKSRRKRRPFVVLDCSAIPRDLMESTVFGHEKGSFTGAVALHRGAFEQAHGGTIFMDEIGELDINLQPKLLRVMENREVKRVGGDKTIRVDVRVVAATNRDLRKMVAEGQFREDLYFRFSVIQIELPPLRDRKADIDLLSNYFLDDLQDRHPQGKRMRLTDGARQMLLSHAWPGNVRELKNVMERAISLSDGDEITRTDLYLTSSPRRAAPASALSSDDNVGTYTVDTSVAYKDAKQELLDGFERAYMSRIIEEHKGNISQAARSSGLTRYHLRELLKKHDLGKNR
jgi:transcriptional regulator with GAF, ATPase, and Fis domain